MCLFLLGIRRLSDGGTGQVDVPLNGVGGAGPSHSRYSSEHRRNRRTERSRGKPLSSPLLVSPLLVSPVIVSFLVSLLVSLLVSCPVYFYYLPLPLISTLVLDMNMNKHSCNH